MSGLFVLFPISARAAIVLSAEPKLISLPGQISTLSWEASKGALCESYADILNEKGQWVWTLSDQWQSAKRPERGTVRVSPERSTHYSLSCTLNGATESASVVVSVGASEVLPPPAASAPGEKPKPVTQEEKTQSASKTEEKKSVEQKVSAPTGGGGGGGGGAPAATSANASGANSELPPARDQKQEQKEEQHSDTVRDPLEKLRVATPNTPALETAAKSAPKAGVAAKKIVPIVKKAAAKISKIVVPKKRVIPAARSSKVKTASKKVFAVKKKPIAKSVKKPIPKKTVIKNSIKTKKK